MNIDNIFQMWEQDCDDNSDQTKIAASSLNLPKLHNKYLRIRAVERIALKDLQDEHTVLVANKKDWMMGTMPQDDLRRLGWNPYLKTLLRSQLDEAISADSDVLKLEKKITIQNEKVDVLDNILKMIVNRSFQLNVAVSHIKFLAGVN